MKRGGNAYRLFEVLGKRNEHEHGPAEHGEHPQPVKTALKTAPPVPGRQSPANARPTLLIGGIEPKPPARPIIAPAAQSAAEPPPAQPPTTHLPTAQSPTARRSGIGQYRGKALVMKYDVAVVAAFALIGLLVIAWVWGHAAGKSAGLRLAQQQGRLVPSAPPDSSGGQGAATPRQQAPIADDGAGDYRIRLLTAVNPTVDSIRDFDRRVTKLDIEERYPNVQTFRGRSELVLCVGRFRTREAAEKYLGHFRAKDSAYKDCYVEKRP